MGLVVVGGYACSVLEVKKGVRLQIMRRRARRVTS